MDYKKLGLKAGLECHQQLDTGKLFCRCPSVLREKEPDIKIKRYIGAVASELGEFDKAALQAAGKEQSFIYEGHKDTTCELEFDECPPRPVDLKALETAFKVSLMCKADILDELFVMRKQVSDGSVVSSFQRTMLVALGGEIELSNKRVGIQTLALEEDAARPMERSQNQVVYRLDRLGIPLIELATAPDLKTPAEVKECAQKIGELFRQTCKAKRGLGTIRQDINVSIARGARVEIKGVQDLGMVDEYVRREVQRQQALLEIIEEMQKRKISEKNFSSAEIADLTQVFSNSQCKFLKGKPVYGIKLHKMQGILGKEVQPERRFGTELAGYVKAKTGLKGIIHSDELPAYEISEREIEHVRHKCNCVMDDGFVLVQADKEKAGKALETVVERIRQALKSVPEETRNALELGNTEYSRPLPGAARMYPETDLAPVNVEAKTLSQLKKELPLTVKEREALYSKHGLSGKLVSEMKLSNFACFFEQLLKKNFNATTAATLFLEGLTQLRREGVKNISNEMVETALLLEKGKKLSKDVLLDFLREWSKNPGLEAGEILKGMKIERIADQELGKIVAEIIEKNKQLVEEKGERAIGALMGEAMKQLKGKADGKTISRILKEEIAKKAKN